MTTTNSEAKDERFRKLLETPAVSWPVWTLFAIALALFIASTNAAISGTLPMWAACIINGFVLYLFFSPMHEALHGTASSNHFMNEAIGRASLAAFIPAAPLEIARWIHLKHHAYTTGKTDPDNFMHHGKPWILPLRWANLDVYYLLAFFRSDEAAVKRHRGVVYCYLLLFAAIVTAFIASGLGFELLVLWFLPTRIGLALVGYIFVFLPHYPANISAKEDKYKATTMRLGWEWLMTPLMVYQNYHLIHHLYPNAPFYNYMKIWRLRHDELMLKNPALQKSFALQPTWR